MFSWQKFLKLLHQRYDPLSMRERLLILVTTLGVGFFLFDNLLLQSQLKGISDLERKVSVSRIDLSTQQQQLLILQEGLEHDENTILREKISQMQNKLNGLDQNIDEITENFITPKEMIALLQLIVSNSVNLELISLRNLPPEKVVIAAISTPDQEQKKTQPLSIYKHGILIELNGGYAETTTFLQQLESLPWQFFWQDIDYLVQQHPKANVTLNLYTLGLETNWIGV